jgi:hypothetical protein
LKDKRRSSRLCPKNRKSKYYEGKTIESYRNGNINRKIMAYAILFSEPADPYSPDVNFLRTGNPVELNTNRESRDPERKDCESGQDGIGGGCWS